MEMTQVRQRIEQATAGLPGKALWKCSRAADMAVFHLGKRSDVTDRHSKIVQVGEYALNVQCAWRIARKDKVVVGSGDLYYPADFMTEDIPPDFDWDKGPNRRDELLRLLFADDTQQFIVRRVGVGVAGSLNITMDDDLSLEIFPNDSLRDEYWRLLRPGSQDAHFVVSGNGIHT